MVIRHADTLVCLQWYVLVITLRLFYTLFGKNNITFGQNFFASLQIGTTVLLLSKAFHTVNHENLFQKRQFHFCFRRVSVQLFSSYLLNRRQHLIRRNSKPFSKNTSCGIPQGSVLRALLFIIYRMTCQIV